jgi:2-polyprenyl-6-methoxyphenol hydroxylase-like FAD-dependent oxidoreductase
MPVRGDHAVVVGASLAGLPAARVLSEFFDRVTVVERDVLPDGPSHRRGVPQSSHLHGILYGGRLQLDELYGDFTETMREFGAPYFDFARHQAFLFPEGWIRRAPGDLMVVFATRWTTEHVVRTLTRRITNIKFLQGQVTGLTASTDGARVTGVTVKGDDGELVLEADLVIDASGRGSKAPKWIEALGYEPPRDSIVQSFLGYATVYGTLPDDAWPGDIKSIAAPPYPGKTRGGFIAPQENGLVGVMAAGQSRDHPPGDPDGFAEFLRTAISPVLYEMWSRLEPETNISTTQTSQNRLRRWHELSRRPGRFIPVGDALAAYNPIYGQGITTAALQANALAARLEGLDDLDAVVSLVVDDLVAVSAFAWSAATDSDLSFPGTEAENLNGSTDPEAAAYFQAVRRLTTEDAYVAQAFFRAMGLQKPELLFTPDIRERVERRASQPDLRLADIARPPAFAEDEVAA